MWVQGKVIRQCWVFGGCGSGRLSGGGGGRIGGGVC